MTERELDMLAAEYVLGTLDETERDTVGARRLHEAELDAAILEWEARLAPLNELVEEVTPPANVLPRIESRVALDVSTSATQPADIKRLQSRVAGWRSAAIVGYALAAGLAGLLLFGQALAPPEEHRYVAVFQEDDQPPRFLLAIDLEKRELTIRPIAAKQHPGKTYQLWIASDEIGPAPRSLGLLKAGSEPTRKSLGEFEPAVLQTATYGISLEPEGGSKTGKPTGPALHGTLYPAEL